MQEDKQIIEIAKDGGFKSIFEKTTLTVFWIKVTEDYST